MFGLDVVMVWCVTLIMDAGKFTGSSSMVLVVCGLDRMRCTVLVSGSLCRIVWCLVLNVTVMALSVGTGAVFALVVVVCLVAVIRLVILMVMLTSVDPVLSVSWFMLEVPVVFVRCGLVRISRVVLMKLEIVRMVVLVKRQ